MNIPDKELKKMTNKEIKTILEEEYAGQAPMNVLVSNMSDKYDMSEEKVDEMVRNLKHKGVIYEPTNGYLKRA